MPTQQNNSSRFSAHFPLRHVIGQVYNTRHELCPMEQTLNPIITQLVTPILFVPLLYQWIYFSRLVITVAFRIHIWVTLLETFLPQQSAQNFPELQKLALREEARFLYSLWQNYLVPSAIGSYNQVPVGNQEQQQLATQFYRFVGKPLSPSKFRCFREIT